MSQKLVPLLARIFLSLIFLFSAGSQLKHYGFVKQYLTEQEVTAPAIFLSAGILLSLIGSLMVMFGYKTKIGAFFLVMFIVPATLIMYSDYGDFEHLLQSAKNLAILGGLLYVLAYGPGGWSFDKK